MGENNSVPEKEPLKRIRGNTIWRSYKLGIVSAHINQNEQYSKSQDIDRLLRKVL